MKKRIIYSSLVAALFSASTAFAGGPQVMPVVNYFDGFYIGGFGGVHHNSFKGSSSVYLTQPITTGFFFPTTLIDAGTLNSASFKDGGYDGYGGIKGGFGKQFGFFYIGGEGWGEWGQTEVTETQTAQVPFNNPVGPFIFNQSASTSTTMKISSDTGGAARIGFLPNPRTLIFGKIGASFARIQVSNDLNVNSSTTLNLPFFNFSDTTSFNANSNSGTHWKEGLVLGAGVEQVVIPNVTVGVEYNYTNYGGVSTGPALLTGGRTITVNGNTFGPQTVTTNVYTQGSVNSVHVSSLLASLNFYVSDYLKI